LVLCLSLRKSANLWFPLSVVALYAALAMVRYRPDVISILTGIWTTDQSSPTLFVGICVMWAAGIMLFDLLRQVKARYLYYALIGQGTIFAAMCVANIWLRRKSVLPLYQFLFADVHSFASYL